MWAERAEMAWFGKPATCSFQNLESRWEHPENPSCSTHGRALGEDTCRWLAFTSSVCVLEIAQVYVAQQLTCILYKVPSSIYRKTAKDY